MHITIEYCVPCGHLERAIQVQRELLVRHGRDLEGVTLRTGAGGVFKVAADDRLLVDAQQDGFDLEAILAAVDRQKVG